MFCTIHNRQLPQNRPVLPRRIIRAREQARIRVPRREGRLARLWRRRLAGSLAAEALRDARAHDHEDEHGGDEREEDERLRVARVGGAQRAVKVVLRAEVPVALVLLPSAVAGPLW
jgi:muconolactone delta-isomerase